MRELCLWLGWLCAAAALGLGLYNLREGRRRR